MSNEPHVPSILVCPEKNGPGIIYDLAEEIGRGGFGSVFRIIRQSDKKDFALKVCPHEALENEQFKAKHFAEIAIQSAMDHPNIIKAVGNWKDGVNTYIVMELCRKGNLQQMLRRKGPLSEAETAKYIKDIIQGVAYCHDHHIIHRDLKLDNFLVADDGSIKITDFGVSEIVDGKNKELVFAGTPQYMGPEVHGLQKYGYQVDIWAIGVCAYELLAGRKPFEAQTMKAMVDLIKAGDFKFPASLKLSFVAKDFIQSALQVKPELRPNIHELALHPFLALANNLQEDDESKEEQIDDKAPLYSVARFCDKSSKYGFGYLLLDGSVGAIFNDYTRMIIDPYSEFIQCYPSYNEKEPIIIPIDKADMKEKHIILLMKFQKALTINKQMFILPIEHADPKKIMPHVKYWLRKDGDILFRMENRVVQVNFGDKNKVLVNFSTKKMLITKSLFEKGTVYNFEEIKKKKEIFDMYEKVTSLLNELSHQ